MSYRKTQSGNTRLNIRLGNYHFYHSSLGNDDFPEGQENYAYLRPEGNFQQLSNWLGRNEAESGSYLITGYRGSGKSSFVKMVLKELNRKDKKKHYIPFFINLGQDNIQEIEVLRILARKLTDVFRKKCRCRWGFSYFLEVLSFSSLVAAALLSLLFFSYNLPINQCFTKVLLWLAALSGVVWGCLEHCKGVRAIRRLERLCSRLNASVTREHGWGIGSKLENLWSGSFSGKYSETLPAATIQEIEYELAEAMKEWTKSNPNHRLVVVFDELDKTDHDDHREDAKNRIPVYEKLSVRPAKRMTSHTRSQQVLEFIANLKFFLSGAPASFLFIAGRELYEAFQADMSDRDFTISSIFNGVINISSFLSSDRHSNSSTLSTEQLVCHYILPPGFGEKVKKSPCRFRYDVTSKGLYSLKNYHVYRRFEQNDRYEHETDEARMTRIWQETLFLYHFVTYLSFISNGSPKKIILFFEKYVRTRGYLKNVKQIDLPSFGSEGKDEDDVLYLSLGYYSICKVNFIHYLTYPIMQNIINRSNLYGDKLLVSASFLMAHIFKLHNSGFSWRNIEQTPEILEINKTPEIREYIGALIDLMSYSYLSVIPCGLYHYKFPMRIVEEISYFSRISKEVSALFNFSRDELKGIKEHYYELLDQPDNRKENAFYARGSLHHSLGDIYMLEENYSNAIREYEQCVEQTLPQVREGSSQAVNYLMFLNRTYLKLGLAHEKRRTDNSAYANYEMWIARLKQPETKKVIRKLLENTRTVHLSLIARLYVLEKIDTTGITERHITEAIDDFEEIFKGSSIYVHADFYRKMGDILYYKNPCWGEQGYSAEKFYRTALQQLLDTEEDGCLELCKQACERKSGFRDSFQDGSWDTDREHYIYSLALVCEDMGHVSLAKAESGIDMSSFVTEFKKMLEKKDRKGIELDTCPANAYENAILYYWTAAGLYNDACERGQSTKCFKELVYTLLTYFRHTKNPKSSLCMDFDQLLKSVINHFLISIYRQYEHIHLSEDNTQRWLQGLEMYQHTDLMNLSITPEVEEMMYIYYTARWELCTRISECWGNFSDELNRFFRSPLMNGSPCLQTLTTMVLNSKLKMRFNMTLLEHLLEISNEKDWVEVDFDSFNNYLEQPLNEWAATSLLEKGQDRVSLSLAEKLDMLEGLIEESLFCLTGILDSVIPMRNTTLFNNLMKGDIYYYTLKMSFFYKMMYCYYSWSAGDYTVRYDVEQFVRNWKEMHGLLPVELTTKGWYFTDKAADFFHRISKATHKSSPSNTYLPFLAENAIHYYKKARQMHTQGKSYQEMIRNLFFLDDDLNNDTLQFYMALERLGMNSEIMKERESKLKQVYKQIRHYDIERYI